MDGPYRARPHHHNLHDYRFNLSVRPGRTLADELRSAAQHVNYSCDNEAVLRRPIELGQYLSIRYTERLAEAGAVASVGSRGDSYDNALAESVIGLYKTELIRPRGPWRGLDEVEIATLEWVDWWNHRRLLGPIGRIPPAEAETNYYDQKAATAMTS